MALTPEQKAFDALPENVQDILLSEETTNTFITIGNDSNIPREKMGHIGRLTTKMVCNLITEQQFLQEIQSATAVSESTAQTIIQAVRATVIDKIKKAKQESPTPSSPTALTDPNQPFTLINTRREDRTAQVSTQTQPPSHATITPTPPPSQPSTPQTIPTTDRPSTIIDEKLSKIVKIPREEVTVRMGPQETRPSLSELDSAPRATATPESTKTPYKDSDPYREPIE